MNHKLLLQNISKHISLTGEEEEQFVALLKSKKLKKKQFLLQEGDIQKQAVYVTDGCLRSYSIIEKALDYIERNNSKLIPLCPMVVSYIKRHPEWKRILDEGVKNN